MDTYIKTGDKIIDEMLRSVIARHSVDGIGLCVCSHGVPIPQGTERVIVLYGDDGYTSSEAHAALTEEYGDDYTCISAPVSVPEFEKALHAVCDAPHDKVTAASDVKYDRANGTVSKNGVTAHLSSKERELFELLWKKRGSVISRESLRQKLWQNTDGTNVPDVYISYLRRKLTPVMGEGTLISIRGRGYMLKDE